jgi:hypothetical protein
MARRHGSTISTMGSTARWARRTTWKGSKATSAWGIASLRVAGDARDDD